MTHGDRYRRMTDEELVDALFANGVIAPPGRNCISECKWDSCRDCWIAYLGEEAEGETKDEHTPNCFTCSHLQIETVDEFPVSKCPFHGEVPLPYTTCCDEYAKGATT